MIFQAFYPILPKGKTFFQKSKGRGCNCIIFSYPKFTKMHKNKNFLCEYYEKLIFLHFLH